MDRLDDSIHISMRVKVIKGIQMDAVEAFRGMAPGDKILIRGQLWSAEKGERGAISSAEPVRRRGIQL